MFLASLYPKRTPQVVPLLSAFQLGPSGASGDGRAAWVSFRFWSRLRLSLNQMRLLQSKKSSGLKAEALGGIQGVPSIPEYPPVVQVALREAHRCDRVPCAVSPPCTILGDPFLGDPRLPVKPGQASWRCRCRSS